jgi:hypothetical protein
MTSSGWSKRKNEEEASLNIFSKEKTKKEIERIPEHFNKSTVCLPRYARKFLTFISIKSISSILTWQNEIPQPLELQSHQTLAIINKQVIHLEKFQKH